MIISALFQFGIGITLINRRADQEIMVKKEMKLSFLSYSIQSEITQRWNEFQSEVSNFLFEVFIFLFYLTFTLLINSILKYKSKYICCI